MTSLPWRCSTFSCRRFGCLNWVMSGGFSLWRPADGFVQVVQVAWGIFCLVPAQIGGVVPEFLSWFFGYYTVEHPPCMDWNGRHADMVALLVTCNGYMYSLVSFSVLFVFSRFGVARRSVIFWSSSIFYYWVYRILGSTRRGTNTRNHDTITCYRIMLLLFRVCHPKTTCIMTFNADHS